MNVAPVLWCHIGPLLSWYHLRELLLCSRFYLTLDRYESLGWEILLCRYRNLPAELPCNSNVVLQRDLDSRRLYSCQLEQKRRVPFSFQWPITHKAIPSPALPFRFPVMHEPGQDAILDQFNVLYLRSGGRFYRFLEEIDHITVFHDRLFVIDQNGRLSFYHSEGQENDYHTILEQHRFRAFALGSYNTSVGFHYFYCAVDEDGALWLWRFRDISYPARLSFSISLSIEQIQVNLGHRSDEKNDERYVYLVDSYQDLYIVSIYPGGSQVKLDIRAKKILLFDRDHLAVITPEGSLCFVRNTRGHLRYNWQPLQQIHSMARYRDNELLVCSEEGYLYHYNNYIVSPSWIKLSGLRGHQVSCYGPKRDRFYFIGHLDPDQLS